MCVRILNGVSEILERYQQLVCNLEKACFKGVSHIDTSIVLTEEYLTLQEFEITYKVILESVFYSNTTTETPEMSSSKFVEREGIQIVNNVLNVIELWISHSQVFQLLLVIREMMESLYKELIFRWMETGVVGSVSSHACLESFFIKPRNFSFVLSEQKNGLRDYLMKRTEVHEFDWHSEYCVDTSCLPRVRF